MTLHRAHNRSRRHTACSLVVSLVVLVLSACTPATTQPAATQPAAAPAMQGELTVFAAASLTEVFTGIGASLEEANPGVKVTFNFAGSSVLRTQLSEGAQADVFASADETNMQRAQDDGVIAGAPVTFARNSLVIITPAQSEVEIGKPQDLANPGIRLVIGQEDVPVGNYARQILAKMDEDPAYGAGFSDKVLANVISLENSVKSVVAKVQLGEADAGIVYATDVTTAVRDQVKIVAIPDDLNVIASYPVAVVEGAANEAAAQAFIDYLLSPAGQAELEKQGFARVDTQQ